MKTSTIQAIRISLATAFIFSALGFYALPARAQSAQSTSSSSDFLRASNGSSFQNAGFQQSGGSAATTAGGSASALHQIVPGPLDVSGAPANQSTASQGTATPNKFWFTLIFVASAVGLVLVYLYTKRTQKEQGPKEAAFAKEVIDETIDEAKPAKAKKDTSKKKKKNKKHHR